MVKSEVYDLDQIFHALADPTRRTILRDVSKRERTISEIAKPHRMSLAAVSKHLKVLEGAQLIHRRKKGSFHLVRLNARALKTADGWLRHYQKFWERRLDALQDFLEKGNV